MYAFKLATVISLVTASVSSLRLTLPQELQEYVDDLHKLCLNKGGLQEIDHQTYDIKNKDEKIMCYMKCLMLESKWMKPDGTIDYEFIEAQAHPDVKEILIAATDKCKIIADGADLCEKAYNFNYCMYEADPKNWFFV